ncbi:uncharacterized protein [Ptychodera flava]|uniref:uncharacterized protein n=1 Tax=Ptychodera flava TaxID=63121 RepID=UPI00396A84C7
MKEYEEELKREHERVTDAEKQVQLKHQQLESQIDTELQLLLQLRQCLSGEALKAIENLGHSATAYEAAKDRLNRKYGGKRRQIALHIEELENFKAIRPGHPKDVEKFADLLDITVINLKEAGRDDELGQGSLYIKLQKKMTKTMLSQYHRWLFEKEKIESVEVLREWINKEAEFQTITFETVEGLSDKPAGVVEYKKTRNTNKTFFGHNESTFGYNNKPRGGPRLCKFCNNHHGVWKCEEFKKMDAVKSYPEEWESRITVNALLDDASTKTYVNADIAAELSIKGEPQRVDVNVLNGQIETCETMPVEVGLESVNGRVDMKVTAFTNVVDWSKYAGRWSHLDGISFPKLGSKPIIDILIGMDYADLHYSYRDIRGRPGEPIARLTPLGWTCIGNTVCSNVDKMQHQTNFTHTYFVKHSSELAEINNTLRQFWEIDDIPDISGIPVLSRDDQIALHKVQNSLTVCRWKIPGSYSLEGRRP